MRVIWRSRILDGAERVAGRIARWFGESRILRFFSTAYPRLERAFRHGRLGCVSHTERDREGWQYRFRRKVMRELETSRILYLFHRLIAFVCETSTASVGSLGVLYGGFSAVLWLMGESSARSGTALTAYLILTVISVPLLSSPRPLARDLWDSFLAAPILRTLFDLPSAELLEAKRGRDRHWLSLLLAFFGTVAGIWVSPVMLGIFLLASVLLSLLFTVPELCSVAVFLLLPFLNWTASPTRVLCLLAALALVTWLGKALSGRRRFSFGTLDACVLLFALSTVLGGAVSAGGVASRASATASLILILFWFPVRNLLVQTVWRRRTLTALCLSSGVTAMIAVLQYVLGFAELRWVDTARFGDIGGRVVGSFSNPNILAVYLLLCAPFFLLGALDATKGKLARVLFGVGGLTVAAALVLTWSRGAWLGFLLGMLVFFLCYSRRTAGGTLLLSVPLLSLLPLLPHSVVNRFSSITSLGESSIRYRLYTWRGVGRMIADHPFGIGVGTETFARVYPRYAVSGAEAAVHTHHLWLRVLSEQGIGGLLILLLLLLLLLLCFFSALAQNGERRGEAVASASALIAVLTMGLFDDIWYHFGMQCLFFAVGAILGLSGEREERECL